MKLLKVNEKRIELDGENISLSLYRYIWSAFLSQLLYIYMTQHNASPQYYNFKNSSFWCSPGTDCSTYSSLCCSNVHPAEVCGNPGSEGDAGLGHDVLQSLQIGNKLTLTPSWGLWNPGSEGDAGLYINPYTQLRSVETLALKVMQVWDMRFRKACR